MHIDWITSLYFFGSYLIGVSLYQAWTHRKQPANRNQPRPPAQTSNVTNQSVLPLP